MIKITAKFTPAVILAGLFFALLQIQSAQARDNPHQPIDAQFDDHAKVLNELSERRRIRSLFNNEQSIFYGLKQHFVNVGRGNLSFVRRDLVTVGRIPLTIARVYDSSLDDGTTTSDFGPGWQLSVSETIKVTEDGTLQYRDDSAVLNTFVPATMGYQINPAQNSDIKAVDFNPQGLLTISYLTGWSKQFEKQGDQYRLSTITDNNGNQIFLLYHENQLISLKGDNRHIDILRDDSGRIKQITDDQNRTVSYYYNDKGQLNGVTDLAGHLWQYKYHNNQANSQANSQANNHLLHKIIDPLGQPAAKFSYNKANKAKSVQIRDQKYRYQYTGNKTIVSARPETLFCSGKC